MLTYRYANWGILIRGSDYMPENIRNIIYRFSQELRRILGDKLTKIIVYGSYARGDFRENSDIDIMIRLTGNNICKQTGKHDHTDRTDGKFLSDKLQTDKYRNRVLSHH